MLTMGLLGPEHINAKFIAFSSLLIAYPICFPVLPLAVAAVEVVTVVVVVENKRCSITVLQLQWLVV